MQLHFAIFYSSSKMSDWDTDIENSDGDDRKTSGIKPQRYASMKFILDFIPYAYVMHLISSSFMKQRLAVVW